ncbi:MAG: hypothetical protein ACLU84_07430 [Clostridia bacterium]
MEYTKDVVFNVKYADTIEHIELVSPKWTSRAMKVMKSHKWICVIMTMTIVLVGVDAILMANFIELFSKL